MATILDDLQREVVPAGTVERLRRDVADLRDRGARAIILGCTDLPVAINAGNSPLPVLDTARIHVDAVLFSSGPSGLRWACGLPILPLHGQRRRVHRAATDPRP